MNDNLDDYDFTPTSSSNLASLFDISSSSSDASSLIYTAPKQPKPMGHSELKNESSKTESCVICARVVQVWKLVDNKYIAIGKHGLAIIGSSTQNAYEMILYREKSNVIVRIKISSSLEITLKKDGFASFYDSLKANWLIKFNNSDDCTTVLNHFEQFGAKTVTAVEKTENVQTTKKEDNATKSTDVNDSPENRAKADILSRIAKMGQSILPNKNLDVEDSEFNTKTELETSNDAKVFETKHVPPSSSPIQSFETNPIIPSSSQTNIIPTQHYQTIPNTLVIGHQAMNYDPLNLYLAENRAQSAEMRLNLSQISDKVNQILKLVDNEKSPANDNGALQSKIKVLDLRAENLAKEVRFYEEENSKLKLQVRKLEELIEADELKKTELNNSREQETIKITELEEQVMTYKDDIRNLSEVVEKQKSQIEELKLQAEKSEENFQLKNEISEMDAIITDLKSKLQDYEQQENTRLKISENKETVANFTVKLKDSMNNLYGRIMANFEEDKKYSISEINSIIAQNIKSTTLNVIQNFQQIHNLETN